MKGNQFYDHHLYFSQKEMWELQPKGYPFIPKGFSNKIRFRNVEIEMNREQLYIYMYICVVCGNFSVRQLGSGKGALPPKLGDNLLFLN